MEFNNEYRLEPIKRMYDFAMKGRLKIRPFEHKAFEGTRFIDSKTSQIITEIGKIKTGSSYRNNQTGVLINHYFMNQNSRVSFKSSFEFNTDMSVRPVIKTNLGINIHLRFIMPHLSYLQYDELVEKQEMIKEFKLQDILSEDLFSSFDEFVLSRDSLPEIPTNIKPHICENYRAVLSSSK